MTFIATDLPHPAIAQLIKTLQGFPVKRLILFGSRARGGLHNARTDIDLAVDAENLSERDWLFIGALPEALPALVKIDLLHLQQLSPDFQRAVLSEGKVLYEA